MTMRPLLKILLIGIALAAPVYSATASAEPGTPQGIRLAQGGGVSLNQAVEQVRRQYPGGRIISADTKVSGGREVHHIRVMVDGKVKTVKINGRKRG